MGEGKGYITIRVDGERLQYSYLNSTHVKRRAIYVCAGKSAE